MRVREGVGPSHILRPSLAHALALALALVSGCILTGAPDDLSIVCERKTGSPWRPYAPDEVKAMTLIEPGATAAGVNDAAKAAADRVLTLGAAPYDRFEAHLFRGGGEREGEHEGWVFDANGTKRNATDRYVIVFAAMGGTLVPRDPSVYVPASLLSRAADIVARDPEARALVGDEAPVAGHWDANAPSCVIVQYGLDHRIVVNVVQQRVVHAG